MPQTEDDLNIALQVHTCLYSQRQITLLLCQDQFKKQGMVVHTCYQLLGKPKQQDWKLARPYLKNKKQRG
jgi:DNA-binding transcriptional MerR regulator